MFSALIRRFRQRRYGKSYLTAVGWYYLGLSLSVFAAAVMREINLLMILTGLMIGPFLYSRSACRLRKEWFVIERRFPDSVHARVPFLLQETLTNQSRYTLFALVGSQTIVRLANARFLESFVFWTGLERKPHAAKEAKDPNLSNLSFENSNSATNSDRTKTETGAPESLFADTNQSNASNNTAYHYWAGFLFCQLSPGEKRRESVQADFSLPGQYQLPPVELYCRFPLGLFECRIKIGNAQSFWVYPPLGKLVCPIRRIEAFSWDSSLCAGNRLSAQDGDFHSVALWRNGQSQRRIHWRSSARRGELVVKQYQTPQSGSFMIWVDLRQEYVPNANSHAKTAFASLASADSASNESNYSAPEKEFRQRISLAATILDECCLKRRQDYPEGLQITLICSGQREYRCSGRNDSAFYHKSMKLLASVDPVFVDRTDFEPDLASVSNPNPGPELPSEAATLSSLTESMRQKNTRVLILTSSDRVMEAAWQKGAHFTQIINTQERALKEWFQTGDQVNLGNM